MEVSSCGAITPISFHLHNVQCILFANASTQKSWEVLKMCVSIAYQKETKSWETLSLRRAIFCRLGTRWSNLAKFLPLVRARIVSGHLSESGQFCAKCKRFNFSTQVRWKCEPAVLGENFLNMTSVELKEERRIKFHIFIAWTLKVCASKKAEEKPRKGNFLAI